MELVAKIVEFTPLETGTSTHGEWAKRQVVVRTLDQNPVDIALTVMNARLNEAEKFSVGSFVRVRFGVSSRKVNDKYYTDAQLWSIQNA